MNIRFSKRMVFLATALSALVLAGSAADQISDNAKAFQAELEAMNGRPLREVLDKLAGWKFEPLSAWTTEDAASKEFKQNNTGKTKFSKNEIAAVFQPGGKYKIAVYGLQVGTTSATTGQIDEMGRGVAKDTVYTVLIYTAIRIVFRDDRLVDVRTWPKLDRSSVSGGMWRDR